MLKKVYSEHLERYYTSLAFMSDKCTASYNLCNGKISYMPLRDLSYGCNTRVGYVDTTGTGARNAETNLIIEKAISELIEKNELLLFWYLGLGKRLEKEQYIEMKLREYGLTCYDSYFFQCQNISSWPTIIALFTKDSKIVTTGISCNKDIKKAMDGAINEAKTLRVLNMLQWRDSLQYSEAEHEEIIEYINTLYDKNVQKHCKFQKIENVDIELAEWIGNLEISMICSRVNSNKVISVISDELIKCIPIKKNLQYCKDVEIIKKYNISNIDKMLDCIVM